MSEYIKKGDAIEAVSHDGQVFKSVLAIEHIPSADVVEVVRCKDCIHYDEHTRWQCDKFGQSVNADDYCSYGEKKEQEHE